MVEVGNGDGGNVCLYANDDNNGIKQSKEPFHVVFEVFFMNIAAKIAIFLLIIKSVHKKLFTFGSELQNDK